MERKGEWAQTFTGKQFWPLDPKAEEVDLRDIAHALASQCRFNGHSIKFYSVAQHSVLVSEIVDASQVLAALLHDASEAYVGDIVKPLKLFLPKEFKEIELRIEDEIFRHFGINIQEVNHKEIKLADNRLLVTEIRDVMGTPSRKWNEDGFFEPLSKKIIPLPPEEAEKLFLERFKEITGKNF